MAHEGAHALNCPACSYKNPEGVQFCIRCRLSFHKRVLFLTRFRDHFFWILRRANAGFVTGMVAWFFIPALSRVLTQDASPYLVFFLTGLLGGAFLGSVDGMIEESTPKTIRGCLFGGLGGALGGLIFGSLQTKLSPEYLPWGLFTFWAMAGAGIGLVSASWEKRSEKLITGVIAGIFGGGTGGVLGYMMYANLVQQWTPDSWILKRFQEGFSGGIIGLTLWFCIALAERFVIFKRTPVAHPQNKTCHVCETKNPLFAWYCGSCGSVLQESAPAGSLNLSAYSTLDRFREMFRFMSRLSTTTGFIAGVVVFFIFLPIHKLLAMIALILTAVAGYCLMILFSALSETVAIFIGKK